MGFSRRAFTCELPKTHLLTVSVGEKRAPLFVHTKRMVGWLWQTSPALSEWPLVATCWWKEDNKLLSISTVGWLSTRRASTFEPPKTEQRIALVVERMAPLSVAGRKMNGWRSQMSLVSC